MKGYLTGLAGIVLTTAISCKNHDNIPSSHAPSTEIGDAKTVLLKGVVTVALPDPHFHFVYDDNYSNKKVSEINDFSGLCWNKIRNCRFSYNSNHLLTPVLCLDFSTNCNGNLYKKSKLTSLATTAHYSISPGKLTLLKSDEFSITGKKDRCCDPGKETEAGKSMQITNLHNYY